MTHWLISNCEAPFQNKAATRHLRLELLHETLQYVKKCYEGLSKTELFFRK